MAGFLLCNRVVNLPSAGFTGCIRQFVAKPRYRDLAVPSHPRTLDLRGLEGLCDTGNRSYLQTSLKHRILRDDVPFVSHSIVPENHHTPLAEHQILAARL